MEKLPHLLNYHLFNTRIFTTSFIVLCSLSSYYGYKKILPLLLSGNKQLWKKIPFIHKKVENERRKMKEKNNEDTETSDKWRDKSRHRKYKHDSRDGF